VVEGWPRASCVLILTLAFGSSAGCREATRGMARRSAGDTVIVEDARPRVSDTVAPVEMARYGRVEGPVDAFLDNVLAFAVDGTGAVFVNDRTGGIRRFTPEGAFDGYVARSGEGPGEVKYAAGMDASGKGIVAVSDAGNRRITVLRSDSLAWEARMPEGIPVYGQGAIALLRDGTVWIGYNPPYPKTGGIGHPRAVFLHVSDSGTFVDTLSTPANAAAGCPTLSDLQNRAGFWEDRREPFVPKVEWALGPDGTFVVGCTATYGFTVYRRDAKPMRVERAWRPIEVSREERAFRARFPVPKAGATLPSYARIVVPGDGRIWVWPRQSDVKDAIAPEVAERFGVDHTWAIPWQGVFDVFGNDGEWLAVVRLPERARYSGYPTQPPVVVRGDTLWAVERDSLDVETIVRYMVPGLPAGR